MNTNHFGYFLSNFLTDARPEKICNISPVQYNIPVGHSCNSFFYCWYLYLNMPLWKLAGVSFQFRWALRDKWGCRECLKAFQSIFENLVKMHVGCSFLGLMGAHYVCELWQIDFGSIAFFVWLWRHQTKWWVLESGEKFWNQVFKIFL